MQSLALRKRKPQETQALALASNQSWLPLLRPSIPIGWRCALLRENFKLIPNFPPSIIIIIIIIITTTTNALCHVSVSNRNAFNLFIRDKTVARLIVWVFLPPLPSAPLPSSAIPYPPLLSIQPVGLVAMFPFL